MGSHNISELMQELVTFAQDKNPIWPFASMIVNAQGKVLIKATDCAHISPLFHSESLAIHMLITKLKLQNLNDLTLISTCEPDPLSQSSLYWANITKEIRVQSIYFGVTLDYISKIWPFGIKISAREIIERSSDPSVVISGSVCEDECKTLFQDAKKRQLTIDDKHPGAFILPDDIEHFYEV